MTAARATRAVLLVAVGAVLFAAGCTSAVNGAPTTPHSPPHSSGTPSTLLGTPTVVVTAPKSTAASSPRRHRRHRHSPAPTPSSTAPSSTYVPPPPPSSTPAAPKSTCHKVSVRVIPGGAAEGTEIAALQFTNEAKHGCVLAGYPQVALLRKGKTIGTPAQPGGPVPGRAVQIAPGKTVQSMLRDYSTCQAPLSDNARVGVPGESTTVVRPAELRACTLRVGQLGSPH